MLGTKSAGWDAKMCRVDRHTVAGPGTGLPNNAGTAEFGSWGTAQSNSRLQQSSKVIFALSEGRRLAGSAGAGATMPKGKSCLLIIPGRFLLQPTQLPLPSLLDIALLLLLLTTLFLPQGYCDLLTPWASWGLLWVLTKRRLPPDVQQKRKEAVLGWHGTWRSCYRRRETKGRAIAGLHVFFVILCPCTLPWPWGRALEIVGQSRLGSPVSHTHTHMAQAAAPHSCPGRKNRQLSTWGISSGPPEGLSIRSSKLGGKGWLENGRPFKTPGLVWQTVRIEIHRR